MIKKAKIKDIPKIHKLINKFASKDLMLPRSLNELYENIRDFWVFEREGKILGCCALHIDWQDLAEIKCLAVKTEFQDMGIGRQLVLACIGEAMLLGAKEIFVLTYKPGFFKKFKFRRIRHTDLPHKIWFECTRCPKFPDCKEIAMIKKI